MTLVALLISFFLSQSRSSTGNVDLFRLANVHHVKSVYLPRRNGGKYLFLGSVRALVARMGMGCASRFVKAQDLLACDESSTLLVVRLNAGGGSSHCGCFRMFCL